ncbi:helix-turn-helix transcriptional regulator [Phenylobacterium sp.]|uniref:helix-turn-helix domain-containing protein n=1 Tax=Phenylobacterium sp. TaxID=1871053 RepID=UPI0028A1222E|nr:helix-turn-helix transcriptional regulator [Phenylobacterium sp.]
MTESDRGPTTDAPVDRLVIQLRAYVAGRNKRGGRRAARPWTSGIAVVFDTETVIDASQRLRFGVYQVRDRGQLIERGLFHDDDAPGEDLAALRAHFATLEPSETGEELRLLSRAEFVERVIFGWGLEVGGQIVGFNLPFDLSRIAISHTYGKGTMKGGFSFTLAEGRPNLRIKHLSQRAAFINFAGKNGDDKTPDRGFFVDVKTLAASLTGQSHSLQSLSKLLRTTPKSPLDSYDGAITPEMIGYCMNDVQATWECFEKLAERYAGFGLAQTGMHELYSEASLGKAYLQAMGINPWQEVQPDFPPELIGQIMSTYFGGRAEVHIRREITPVIHCDFLSMYPTVCTLMGLWRFVIADGMTWLDATEEVRAFVDGCDLAQLRAPAIWRELHCIVQVRADDDVFRVRAQYEPEGPATIGVNRLTSREPMWFTLADVLAAKLLSGKTPEIIAATRFAPMKPQAGLKSVVLAGAEVRPATDDFYALLINQRRRAQAQEDAATGDDKAGYNAIQQGLKILANSTSYGIFVELNVQQLDKSRVVLCYDFRGVGRKMTTSKLEDAGRYFHPLLGSLITGAARLMLALAERNALDQGLSWAFCDTDSLAIANAANLNKRDSIDRVKAVLVWFEPLNPYEAKGSILQLEKVNFPPGQHRNPDALLPVNCLAISAKRYVLFDRAAGSAPVIRKASAHGLGHMLPPYKDPDPTRVGRIGVQLWQEELWRQIVLAYDLGRPDQPDLSGLAGLDQPAPTRYAVTNQALMAWFKGYNQRIPEHERVRPFNFLLTFQAKSRMEMASTDQEGLGAAAWNRRTPKPASRYSSNIVEDRPDVFDRATGEPVPWNWLRSYRRALAAHHLHSESKFLGGEGNARGPLMRRHVEAWAVIPIGKEADNLEEREVFGAGEGAVEWELARADRQRLLADITSLQASHHISDRTLTDAAHVSHHTLNALRNGRPMTSTSVLRLACAAEELRRDAVSQAAERTGWLEKLHALRERVGSGNRLADLLGVSRPYLHRVMRGTKPLTNELVDRLEAVLDKAALPGS